jgi:hypothetical protein
VKWTTRILLVLCAYFCGWVVFYTLLVGIDYRFIAEYLRLAWTGGGVLPTYINIGALATACIEIVVVCVLPRRHRRD